MANPFSRIHTKVREINKRYETPDIEMSGAVKFSLLLLRLYLIMLIVLSMYKFVTLLK